MESNGNDGDDVDMVEGPSKVVIDKLAANVQGLRRHVKDFTVQFGEDHSCTDALRQELQQQDDLLKTQRDQRRSKLPVSELRRRAEKEREVTISKIGRITLEIKEGQELREQI
jgi:hypothetical protein